MSTTPPPRILMPKVLDYVKIQNHELRQIKLGQGHLKNRQFLSGYSKILQNDSSTIPPIEKHFFRRTINQVIDKVHDAKQCLSTKILDLEQFHLQPKWFNETPHQSQSPPSINETNYQLNFTTVRKKLIKDLAEKSISIQDVTNIEAYPINTQIRKASYSRRENTNKVCEIITKSDNRRTLSLQIKNTVYSSVSKVLQYKMKEIRDLRSRWVSSLRKKINLHNQQEKGFILILEYLKRTNIPVTDQMKKVLAQLRSQLLSEEDIQYEQIQGLLHQKETELLAKLCLRYLPFAK